MPELCDLTDVCKDGNLLKVNSCNCAGKLDEAKEGVSMVSVSIRGGKKSLKRSRVHFKAWQRTNIYGCVSCGRGVFKKS